MTFLGVVWWGWLLAIPAFWFFSLLTHELSHLVTAWLAGAKDLKIFPYPHKHNDTFYWGRTSWRGFSSKDKGYSLSTIAPLLKAALSSIYAVTLAATVSPVFLLWWVTETVDIGWWWRGYFMHELKPKSDGAKFRRLWEAS